MNETLKTIQTRRSCRAFTGAAIAHTDLEAIAAAGAAAPSARNRHTRRLTVVQDKALLEKLACLVADAVGAGSDYNFYRPDALILLSDTSENPLAVEDCACALENIFLAAESLGIRLGLDQPVPRHLRPPGNPPCALCARSAGRPQRLGLCGARVSGAAERNPAETGRSRLVLKKSKRAPQRRSHLVTGAVLMQKSFRETPKSTLALANGAEI